MDQQHRGRAARPVLVSFEIDGAMELGHPPGPVTIELVRALAGFELCWVDDRQSVRREV